MILKAIAAKIDADINQKQMRGYMVAQLRME